MSIKSQHNVLSTQLMALAVPATLASSLLLAGSVSAQEAEANSSPSFTYEEIIVTSSRRAETLQDVPASISALTTEDIELQGFDNFEGFARSLPGVTLNQPIKNRSVFNIRGLSTSVGGGNTQDPVSVYINDMPVTDTFGASVQPDLRLYDIERIEVLRGPQGTLFGSGSLGGTVRVITRKPEPSNFDASVRVDLGDTDNAGMRERYDAMVNIPLVEDVLAMRAVGYYRDEAGWVDNMTAGTDNSFRDWGGRLSVLWQASDEFTATVEALHQNSNPDDGDAWDPALGKFKKSSAVDEGRPSELTSYNLTLEYEFVDFATLVSSTSYTESETAVRIDYGDITGLGFPLIARNEPWEINFLSQEFRLISDNESDLEWVVGAFFIERESDADFNFTLEGLADFVNANIAPGLLENDNFLVTQLTSKSQEIAGFGELKYRFNDNWKATVGMRVSDVEVSMDEPFREVLNFATFGQVRTENFHNEGKDSGNVIWRTMLSYEPVDDLHFYGSVSTGYRIGQTNPFVGPSLVDPTDIEIANVYDPDETVNYELGAKTVWWDHRLKFNAVAYYIIWSDIQVDALRRSDAANYIANAGEAISQGLELELQVLPMEGLTVDVSVTLQDTEIDSISDRDSENSGVVKGDSLPGSGDYKVSAALQYEWAVANGDDMYARLAVQYVDSSVNGFSNLPGLDPASNNPRPNPYLADNEAYENVDASIGYIADQWEMTLYGENLTNNDDYILNGGGSSQNYITTLRPRTLGVRMHYRY